MAIKLTIDIQAIGAETTSKLLDDLAASAQKSLDATKKMQESIKNTSVDNAVKSAKDSLKNTTESTEAIINNNKNMKQIFQDISTNLINVRTVEQAKNVLGGFFNDLGNNLKASVRNIGDFSNILNGVFTAMAGTFLIGQIQDVFNSIADSFRNMSISMAESMDIWSEKAKQAETMMTDFSFNIKAAAIRNKQDIDKMTSSWTNFADTLAKNSLMGKSDILNFTQQMVRVGKEAGASDQTIRTLISGLVDFVPKESAQAGQFALGTASVIMTGMNDLWDKFGINLEMANMQQSRFFSQNQLNINAMTQSEIKLARIGMLLDFLATQTGKSTAALNTMVGAQTLLQKELDLLRIKFGDNGVIIKTFNILLGELVSIINLLPDSVLKTVGVLWSFFSIMLNIIATITSLIVPIGLLAGAWFGLTFAINSSIAIQGMLTSFFAVTSAWLGIQTVAVTSATTAWAAFQVTIAAFGTRLLALFPVMIASVTSFLGTVFSMATLTTVLSGVGTAISILTAKTIALSKAILMSPLMWKTVAIIGVIYLVVKAFQQLEQKTQFISKFANKISAAFERVTGAFKKSETQLTAWSKAMLFLQAIVENTISIVELLVSLIINGLAGAFAILSGIILVTIKQVQAVTKAFGLQSETIDDATEMVQAFHEASLDLINTLSGNMKRTLSDIYKGSESVSDGFKSAKNSGNAFKTESDAITEALKKQNEQLTIAKKKLDEMKRAADLAAASGKTVKAEFMQGGILEQQKQVAKIEGQVATTKGDIKGQAEASVTMADLSSKVDENAAKIAAKTDEVMQANINKRIGMNVEVLLDTKQFDKALQAAIKGNAEIQNLESQMKQIEPFVMSSDEAAKRYKAYAESIKLIQDQLKNDFMKKEQEFQNERVEATKQANEEIVKNTGDTAKQLEMERDKDIAKYQEQLQKKLISQEQYEKNVKSIQEKYAKDSADLQLKITEESITEQLKALEKLGKVSTDEYANLKRQLEGLQIDKMVNIADVEKNQLQTQASIDSNMAKIQNKIAKYTQDIAGDVRNTFSGMPIPREIFESMQELGMAQVKVAMKMDGADAAMETSRKNYVASLDEFNKKVKETFKEMMSEGRIVDAQKLMQDYKEFEGKMSNEVIPGFKDEMAKLASGIEIFSEDTKLFDKFGENMEKEVLDPVVKIMEKMGKEISLVEAKWIAFEENAISVFDAIDMASIDGFAASSEKFFKDFEKINPASVLTQIMKKVFDNPDMRDKAKDMVDRGTSQMISSFSNAWQKINGFATTAMGNMLLMAGKTNMWGALFEFFSKDEVEFKKAVAEKIKVFLSFFQRLAQNIPTLFVSFFARTSKIITQMVGGIYSLLLNLVSMLPVMFTKAIVGMFNVFSEEYKVAFTKMAKEAESTFVAAWVEFFSFIPVFFGKQMRIIASIISELVLQIYNWIDNAKEKLITRIGDSVRSLTGIIISSFESGTDSWVKMLTGIGMGFSAVTKVMASTQKNMAGVIIEVGSQALMSIGMLVHSVAQMFGEMSKNANGTANGVSKAMVKMMYVLQVVTTVYQTMQQIIRGEWMKSAATLFSGLTQASGIAALDKDFQKFLQDTNKNASETTNKWIADEEAKLATIEEIKGALKETSRTGSDEFKIKDAPNLEAEKAVADYSLATASAIKASAADVGEMFDFGALDKSSQNLMDTTKLLEKILGGWEIALLILGAPIIAAVAAISAFWGAILGIVLAVTVLVALVIKYWDKIKEALDDLGQWFKDVFAEIGAFFVETFAPIGEAFTNFGNSIAEKGLQFVGWLGEGAGKLGTAIADGALQLWDYVSSGKLLEDFSKLGADFDANVIQPLVNWATNIDVEFKNFVSSLNQAWQSFRTWVIDPIIQAMTYIYNTFLLPFIQGVQAVFVWLNENVFIPATELFKAAFQWIYDNIILPVGTKIQEAFQWVYDVILAPVIGLFETVFTYIYDKIVAAFSYVYTTFLEPSINLLKATFAVIQEGFTWIDTNIFQPFINGITSFANAIKTPFQWIYDNIIKPIVEFNPAGKAGNWIEDTAGSAWKGVKSIFKAHGGIIPQYAHGGMIYQAASGMLVPGLAAGGNNYGRDTVPAMLSPGEMVLPNSVTQRGDLMRDLAGLVTGENRPSASVTNIANSSTNNQTINLSINVDGNARMTRQDVERDILPAILTSLKDASSRGKPVLNEKGLYK